eukprot:scaffold80189_cov57-Phaeocystis_antarctica.AAC.1
MHFGAIRKPRTYSNLPLSQKNGWLLPNASDVGEGGTAWSKWPLGSAPSSAPAPPQGAPGGSGQPQPCTRRKRPVRRVPIQPPILPPLTVQAH